MGAVSNRRACNSANRAIERSHQDAAAARPRPALAPVFSTADPDSWPVLLSLEQIAAIYQRKPSGVAKSCQQRTFQPAPFLVHPYRWKKTDLMRHLNGGRMVDVQRRAG